MDDFPIIMPGQEPVPDEKLKRAQSLVGSSAGRPKDDFYPTPPAATEALLGAETFLGDIWEPACGDGAISKVLGSRGHKVLSTDLVYRGYGEGGHDFFASEHSAANIITNPPYSLGQEFIEHALKKTTGKVAMLMKLAFLEGAKRKTMFETTPLARVHVFSKRLKMARMGETEKYGSGMIAFAWFVFEHGYEGEPVIRWI